MLAMRVKYCDLLQTIECERDFWSELRADKAGFWLNALQIDFIAHFSEMTRRFFLRVAWSRFQGKHQICFFFTLIKLNKLRFILELSCFANIFGKFWWVICCDFEYHFTRSFLNNFLINNSFSQQSFLSFYTRNWDSMITRRHQFFIHSNVWCLFLQFLEL